MNKLSRRLFTQGAAGAGLACTMIPGRVIGANSRVQVGLIGCGVKGSAHLKSFANLETVKIIAVSDPDITRMTDPGGKGQSPQGNEMIKHQDFRRILDMKEIDAVVIAAPNHWHSLATVMACQAGKHVYVEKPVSHAIAEGRKMIEAARKYDRIVQGGTQQRSCPAVQECAADIQSGMYGKVKWVHMSKLMSRKPIGKRETPMVIPDYIDYNLWAGPAPMTPVLRDEFHYDWHWQWNWGNGETGNWGVHYLDDIRHVLGWDDVPSTVVSAGSRWWDDVGETPNMHVTLMQHRGVEVIVDVRTLEDFARGDKEGAIYRKMRHGNFFMCEKGYIQLARGGGKSFDHDHNMIKQYKGDAGAGHDANFIEAIRQNDRSILACEIEVGHYSTVMCHLANASYRIGLDASVDEVRAGFNGNENIEETIDSILAQLNGQHDFAKQPFTLGKPLTYDNALEQFVGAHSEAANQYTKVTYRPEFSVPDKV
jgi:predicted dehydrogenase